MQYDFETKQQYRIKVHNAIDQYCTATRWIRRIAYLESGQALETKFLIARGHRPENLIPINRSPQIAAWINRRVPDVTCLVGEIHRVLRTHQPRPHAINFDGTGWLNKRTMCVIVPMLTLYAPVVAVTILAGREKGQINDIRNKTASMVGDCYRTSDGVEVSNEDYARMLGVRECLTHIYCPTSHDGTVTLDPRSINDIDKLKWGIYISESHQKMIWVVARVNRVVPIEVIHQQFQIDADVLRETGRI